MNRMPPVGVSSIQSRGTRRCRTARSRRRGTLSPFLPSPEADGLGREGFGTDQFALLTLHRLACLVEYLHREAGPRPGSRRDRRGSAGCR